MMNLFSNVNSLHLFRRLIQDLAEQMSIKPRTLRSHHLVVHIHVIVSVTLVQLLVFLAAFDFLLDDLYFGYTPVLKIQYYIVGSAESSQVEERDSTPQPRLQLYLKGPGLPGVRLYINLHYAHKYLSGTKY